MKNIILSMAVLMLCTPLLAQDLFYPPVSQPAAKPGIPQYLAYDGYTFSDLDYNDTQLYYSYYDHDAVGDDDYALSLACTHPNYDARKVVFPLHKNMGFQVRAGEFAFVGFGLECSNWNRCRVISDFYVASGTPNTIAVVDDVTFGDNSNFISYGYYEATSKRNLLSPQDNLNDQTMALFGVDKSLLEEGLVKLETESSFNISVSIRSWDIPEEPGKNYERSLFTEKSGECTLSAAKNLGD
jgi:hypothetical protein